MNRRQKVNPQAGGRRGPGNAAAIGQSNSPRKPTGKRPGWQGDRLPLNWRERLPDPETYYPTISSSKAVPERPEPPINTRVSAFFMSEEIP